MKDFSTIDPLGGTYAKLPQPEDREGAGYPDSAAQGKRRSLHGSLVFLLVFASTIFMQMAPCYENSDQSNEIPQIPGLPLNRTDQGDASSQSTGYGSLSSTTGARDKPKSGITESGASSWIGEQSTTAFPFDAQLPAFLNIFYGSGLCSQLLNLFKTAIYLEETEGRSMMAVDCLYGRYTRKTHGVLKGWFDPKFPVIDSLGDFALVQPYTQNFTFRYIPKTNDLRHCKDFTDGDIRVTCLYDYGREIRNHYHLRGDSTPFYKPLVDKMCPHLQFNAQAAQEMASFREHMGVPAFDENNETTVTFHVRRTDKLNGESDLYKGEEYVSRLVEVAPNVTFDHCFVATDSYPAVPEIEQALRKHNISCKLHYFAREATVSKTETLQFFTELSYMINATYFVGTFNSNVGGAVGVLRACSNDKPMETYANSFGVDSDKWSLR